MQTFIGHEVHYLANLIGRVIDNSPARMQVENVTGKNTWIIGYIAKSDDKPVYQRDLEKHFGITRSTASKVVSLMVRKGLIERQCVPGDARLKRLVLTDQALTLECQMDQEFNNIENTLREGFTEEEIEMFFSYIHRMQENVVKKEGKWNDSKTDAVSAGI
ncbi:MAG: MarR family winged helix-turn-helix transcriptional regulator [Clostridiales bacterium]|nr:MarR family winged helix-turn-helix transcriptional regulator [Clostridiales bacterium]